MPRRKHNPNLIPGSIAQWRRPEWRPLLEMTGDLAKWFMWMGEVELDDGSSVHAYKHRMTRRYLHLGPDGEAYDYVPPLGRDASAAGAYRPVSRLAALEEAIYGWDDMLGSDVGDADVVVGLNRARSYAARGQRMPFDPEELSRQRRFDAAAEAARLHELTNDPGFGKARASDDGDGYYGDLLDDDGEGGLAEAA